jgi:hypothetical protein
MTHTESALEPETALAEREILRAHEVGNSGRKVVGGGWERELNVGEARGEIGREIVVPAASLTGRLDALLTFGDGGAEPDGFDAGLVVEGTSLRARQAPPFSSSPGSNEYGGKRTLFCPLFFFLPPPSCSPSPPSTAPLAAFASSFAAFFANHSSSLRAFAAAFFCAPESRTFLAGCSSAASEGRVDPSAAGCCSAGAAEGA